MKLNTQHKKSLVKELKMNQFDKENLNFLMALSSDEEWEDWAQYCDEDDFAYALELMKRRTAEISLAMEDMVEEKELDLTEANALINKIKGMK
jgi:hypothetical protein